MKQGNIELWETRDFQLEVVHLLKRPRRDRLPEAPSDQEELSEVLIEMMKRSGRPPDRTPLARLARPQPPADINHVH